jgi:putative membrane protein
MTDDAVPVHHPDVRFSLANERTLLAYQRTAVGLLAAAVAVAHFVEGVFGPVLAVCFVVTAAIALGGGYRSYVRTDRAIRSGEPAPAGATTHVLSVGLLVCALVVAVYVVLT